jgi:hypothetical protein
MEMVEFRPTDEYIYTPDEKWKSWLDELSNKVQQIRSKRCTCERISQISQVESCVDYAIYNDGIEATGDTVCSDEEIKAYNYKNDSNKLKLLACIEKGSSEDCLESLLKRLQPKFCEDGVVNDKSCPRNHVLIIYNYELREVRESCQKLTNQSEKEILNCKMIASAQFLEYKKDLDTIGMFCSNITKNIQEEERCFSTVASNIIKNKFVIENCRSKFNQSLKSLKGCYNIEILLHLNLASSDFTRLEKCSKAENINLKINCLNDSFIKLSVDEKRLISELRNKYCSPPIYDGNQPEKCLEELLENQSLRYNEKCEKKHVGDNENIRSCTRQSALQQILDENFPVSSCISLNKTPKSLLRIEFIKNSDIMKSLIKACIDKDLDILNMHQLNTEDINKCIAGIEKINPTLFNEYLNALSHGTTFH